MTDDRSETQKLLKDTVDRLVRDRYSFEQRKKYIAEELGYSSARWKELAELGLLAIEIPEEFGGGGGSVADNAIVLEGLGRGLAVEPFLSTAVLGAGLLASAASEDQKSMYLPRVADGSFRLALAADERDTRYRLERTETEAIAAGDGFVLNGTKVLVLGADSADVVIVLARTAGRIGDKEGVTLFLVPTDAAGLTIKRFVNMDERGAGEILLEAVRVSSQDILGELNAGYSIALDAFDRGAIATCSEAVGAMAALNDMTLDYIKTRKQFGRPIGKFQVLQHRMADMMLAAQEADAMHKLALDTMVSRRAEHRSKAISAAKVKVFQAARHVGRDAIQLHGGIGMTIEYAASHYFRRLTALERMFGDIDYHLERYSLS
jgi:alkylation response protein AidB-like acyl-CoA dehydrogenase